MLMDYNYAVSQTDTAKEDWIGGRAIVAMFKQESEAKCSRERTTDKQKSEPEPRPHNSRDDRREERREKIRESCAKSRVHSRIYNPSSLGSKEDIRVVFRFFLSILQSHLLLAGRKVAQKDTLPSRYSTTTKDPQRVIVIRYHSTSLAS